MRRMGAARAEEGEAEAGEAEGETEALLKDHANALPTALAVLEVSRERPNRKQSKRKTRLLSCFLSCSFSDALASTCAYRLYRSRPPRATPPPSACTELPTRDTPGSHALHPRAMRCVP